MKGHTLLGLVNNAGMIHVSQSITTSPMRVLMHVMATCMPGPPLWMCRHPCRIGRDCRHALGEAQEAARSESGGTSCCDEGECWFALVYCPTLLPAISDCTSRMGTCSRFE
jgi:hypothetical protein